VCKSDKEIGQRAQESASPKKASLFDSSAALTAHPDANVSTDA